MLVLCEPETVTAHIYDTVNLYLQVIGDCSVLLYLGFQAT